ncbi:unconventional myosin-Ic-like [Physella acuta]|uniref:unconventional myosin-Ic-like n=1 Tax=Physella acuta TaxID=109671 RepID=UPI0027DB6192|nr:unconventional myosin-Ic-like [Physella acuta]XP_059166935.1 unconventional myosin-Ic-like [Physella acuta]XP_059166936.1 unconventional myosin-Ic-like [Physella acuta]
MTTAAVNHPNLTHLVDPDEDDITETLQERFKQRCFYTYFGDGIISVNPQSNINLPENLPKNGLRYCAKKPLDNAPPHVYALAHRVYKDVLASDESFRHAHTVIISGASGSGKTETSEILLAQFFRETGTSYKDDVCVVLTKGLFALKSVTSFKTPVSPASSTCVFVVSLFVVDDGTLRSAAVKSHLLAPRYTIHHNDEPGFLNIFYDIVACLYKGGLGLTLDVHPERILNLLDPSLKNMSRELLNQHYSNWSHLVEVVTYLGIGENIIIGRGGSTSNSFLDSLLALLLLANLRFTVNAQTKKVAIENYELITFAAKLLGVSEHALFNSLTKASENDVPPVGNLVLARDQVVHELYFRTVQWLETKINKWLPDEPRQCVPILIAEMPAFNEQPLVSRVTVLCQNMMAEKVQVFIKAISINRETAMCSREGLKSMDLKRQACEDLDDLAFGGSEVPTGLLMHIESFSYSPPSKKKTIIKTLDKEFKKMKNIYIQSKIAGKQHFAIVHSHQQVTYSVNDHFKYDNRIIPNRDVQRLLAASMNPTVKDIYQPSVMEFSDPNAPTNLSYISYIKVKLKQFTDYLSSCVPSFIRCIKPSLHGQEFDPAYVKSQVKSSYLVDLVRHKKFGYSNWLPIPNFVNRYGRLLSNILTDVPQDENTCKSILAKCGILDKGPAVTINFVFLMYWHKEKLDTQIDKYLWKITLTQACVRGYLTRNKLRDVVTYKLAMRDWAPNYKGSPRSLFAKPELQKDYRDPEKEELYEHIINKTLQRILQLPSSVWAKVLYMEQGKKVTKFYAEEKSLLVSGSSEPFDGLELGLGYCFNAERINETQYIINNLQRGIELQHDSSGNILVKKLCHMPVAVRQQQYEAVLSADVLLARGQVPMNKFIKVFDINEFKSLIILEMRKRTFSVEKLRHRCITSIGFYKTDVPLLKMPCWIAVVNLVALKLLDNFKELQDLQLVASQLALSKDENTEKEKLLQLQAKQRTERQSWSKTDQRQHFKLKEQNERKIREELRKRGERISDHMRYSWEEKANKVGINMDQLYEKIKRSNSRTSSPGDTETRQWAKVDVALRQATRELMMAEDGPNEKAD